MQNIPGTGNAFLTFNEKPHLTLFHDRHLLVRLIVLRCHQKWTKAKTADHHLSANEHLAFDSFGRLLNRYSRPVQMLSQTSGDGVLRHRVCLYFRSLTASRPELPAAYSGCTLTTPKRRSSPSLIAAIIHRKLI